MRKFITRLVLPVTLLVFALFTKWWYVYVEDIGNEVMYGFPFIYKCDGWHTSMSTQYFVLELLADFSIYFLTCFLIIYVVRLWLKFRIARTISLLLWVVATLAITVTEIEVMFPDSIFKSRRDFNFEVLDAGIHYKWNNRYSPESDQE